MTFEKLGLKEELVENLYGLGFEYPTEVQQKAIPEILKGKDVVCRSETGSGKTFAFGLPIVQKIDANTTHVNALIVCPTRELVMQVADELKKVATDKDVRVCAVFGGSTIQRQIESLKKCPHIVVGTTGRLMDLIDRKALKIEDADFVVLDEADEMLDMGFRPDIEKILYHTKGDRQTLLFSATISDEVKELANEYQHNAKVIEIGTANKAINKINQYYIFANKKYKKEALSELFFSDVYGKTIVFVNTRQYAEDLEYFLNKSSVACSALHGDLRQNSRKRILQNFRDGKIDILIATDVASRGLDIKEVKYVINYDLPHELEYYVHRIGRTARAGESGTVINIITSLEQLSYMREIEKATNATILSFETDSENLKQYFVDTKRLAKTTNRFTRQKNYERDFDKDYSRRNDKKPRAKAQNQNVKTQKPKANQQKPNNSNKQNRQEAPKHQSIFLGKFDERENKLLERIESISEEEKKHNKKSRSKRPNKAGAGARRNKPKNKKKTPQQKNLWYSKFIKK